jgi:hypothetical protein
MVFSLFKTRLPKVESLVDRLLKNHQNTRNICQDVLPELIRSQKWEYVARNCSSACENTISMASLLHRAKADPESARKEMAECNSFLQILTSGIRSSLAQEKSDKNWIYVDNLAFPFLAAMLVGDWGAADFLANSIESAQLVNSDHGESLSYQNAFVRMLAANITGCNIEGFNKLLESYVNCPHRRRSKFHKKYFTYEQLLLDLVVRDEKSFNDRLLQQEKLYIQRATDATTSHDGVVLDGMLEMNALGFDVWSTGISCLAKHLGVNVTVHSAVIPSLDFLCRQVISKESTYESQNRYQR